MVCLLMPVVGGTDQLVQLFSCRIKVERRGILICGTEYFWQRKRRENYLQALWAWPIPPEPIPPPRLRHTQTPL